MSDLVPYGAKSEMTIAKPSEWALGKVDPITKETAMAALQAMVAAGKDHLRMRMVQQEVEPGLFGFLQTKRIVVKSLEIDMW